MFHPLAAHPGELPLQALPLRPSRLGPEGGEPRDPPGDHDNSRLLLHIGRGGGRLRHKDCPLRLPAAVPRRKVRHTYLSQL